MAHTVAVLDGDQTGQELLEQALRVLHPAVIDVDLDLQHFDLSLVNRRATQNRIVHEAADAMVACGFGIKAATVTPEKHGDEQETGGEGDLDPPVCEALLHDRGRDVSRTRPTSISTSLSGSKGFVRW